MKRSIGTLIKLLISAVGILYALSEISFTDAATLLRNAHVGWLLLTLFLMTASLVVRAYRWLMLLRGLGTAVPFGRLTALYFIGNFFNAITPGGLGGDVVRAFSATRDVPADVAAGTVILDRLCGILALFGMALVGLLFGRDQLPAEWFTIIITICTIGLIGGFILLEGSLIRLTSRLLTRYGDDFIVTRLINNKIMPIMLAVQGCGWAAVGRALAVSAFFNLMMVSWWWSVGRALNLGVAWGYNLIAAPIMSIAQLVSFAGLGGREMIAPSLFAGANLNETEAISLSFLIFILLRLTSLFGVPVYLFGEREKEDR